MFLRKTIQKTLASVVMLLTMMTTVYGDSANMPTITLDLPGLQSSSLPDYYPASYQGTGIINRISSSGDIVISTIHYRLSSNAMIHSTLTEHSSRYDLQVGKEVGFNFNSSGNSRTITEIWILPAGTVLVH